MVASFHDLAKVELNEAAEYYERGVAVVSTLAFASVVLAICGHLLHTRVRMVLPRETE